MKEKINKKIAVLKFGGSSVANISRIKLVSRIIIKYKKKGIMPVVVVSAMGDTTDNLINMAKSLNTHPPQRELDLLLSTGEIISAALLAMAIEQQGYKAVALTGPQVGILTDEIHTQAKILSIHPQRIFELLKDDKIVIVAGFQGRTREGEITTLGRGGSDLSAVALAYALNTRDCFIYTDVEGVFTADPRIVKNAKKIPFISYEEMAELASLGAQVMQTRSIEVAHKYNVRIHVKSTFSNKEGTVIGNVKEYIESPLVVGVTLNTQEAKLTICNVPDRPGIAARIFRELSSNGINVDMIVQNVSHRKQTDISFTVLQKDLNKAYKVTKSIAEKIGASDVLKDEDICRVSIVGVGMKSHVGVAYKMFEALAENHINIEMISTSEISISCIIKKKFAAKATQILHDKFKLYKLKIKTKGRRNL